MLRHAVLRVITHMNTAGTLSQVFGTICQTDHEPDDRQGPG